MNFFRNILYGFGKVDMKDLSPKEELMSLKIESPKKLIIWHLNINSIRNKFECLCDIISRNIDIFLTAESKLNDTFPIGQFPINSFHVPFRRKRTDKGGGLLLYLQEHIPCRQLKVTLESHIEAIFVEINLKKRKWLLIGANNPIKIIYQP